MKIFIIWLIFHWNLFPLVQLAISQHWLRWKIDASQATSHCVNQCFFSYWRVYAWLGLDELHDDVIKWNIFCVTGHMCGEFIGHRWIPHTKASDAELWCFDLRLNKKLSKQWWCWWFESPLHPLWRLCNIIQSSVSRCNKFSPNTHLARL